MTAETRGTPIDLPDWWLDAAKIRIGDRRTAAAAAEISAAVGRVPPWDRSTLGKFLKNDHATVELMDAVCRTYQGLPPVIFRARSLDEANALQAVHERYTERELRRREIDQALDRLENTDGAAVRSSDGTGARIGSTTRRPGGMGSGGKAPRRA